MVKTPKADLILKRCLGDQKPDGSWMLNMPSRDRHATFDAAFTIRQLGKGADSRRALDRAAAWALSCRNSDGGWSFKRRKQAARGTGMWELGRFRKGHLNVYSFSHRGAVCVVG